MITGMKFLADLPLYKEEKPYLLIGFPDVPDEQATNCVYDIEVDVELNDVRKTSSTEFEPQAFNLSTTGFQYLHHKSAVPLFSDLYLGDSYSQAVIDQYLAESVEVVKGQFPDSNVVVFDWRIRKSDILRKDVPTQDPARSRNDVQAPGTVVHCDYSLEGGDNRLKSHLTDEELQLLQSGDMKARFVNLWRSLQTVHCAPLAFCDPRSVRAEDVVEVDKVSPQLIEMGYFLKYRPYHRWYWMPQQQSDEPVLFVSWDPTNQVEQAGYPPHGACLRIRDEQGLAIRESIEIRFIVMSMLKK